MLLQNNSKLKECNVNIFFVWLKKIGEKSRYQATNRILLFSPKHLMICRCSPSLCIFFDENESKSFKFSFPMHITENLMVTLKSLQWWEYGLKKCLNLISLSKNILLNFTKMLRNKYLTAWALWGKKCITELLADLVLLEIILSSTRKISDTGCFVIG